METIKSYLETMFANMPNTPEVIRAKTELLGMMEDKYNELIQEGKSENEAVGTVISEFGNLDELAACLLRWMPPLVPWMLDLQKEVKEQAGEYGSEGKALLAIVKANPDKYKIDYQSKDSPFL